MAQNFFGPIIASYTRAQAIDDGVLVDVTASGREAGFSVPVALTRGAWDEAVAWDESNAGYQDESGRLWDVLMMGRLAAARARTAQRITFTVLRVPNTPTDLEPTALELSLHIGPGDAGEPVITVLLPHED